MFSVKDFVSKPTATALKGVHKSDWLSLAKQYDLEPRIGMLKAELQVLVTDHLVEKEILTEEEVDEVIVAGRSRALEVARLQVERERER